MRFLQRSMRRRLPPRHYLYISDDKLDMLLPQISSSVKKTVAKELRVDAQLFTASYRTETTSIADRVSKLKVVERYLRNSDLTGPVGSSRDWISGSMDMAWGGLYHSRMETDAQIVWFGGRRLSTYVGLAGSARHQITAPDNSSVRFRAGSSAPSLFAALWEYWPSLFTPTTRDQTTMEIERHLREDSRPTALEVVARMVDDYSGPVQRVDFLARTLLTGPGTLDCLADGRRYVWSPPLPEDERSNRETFEAQVILATPLYVALAPGPQEWNGIAPNSHPGV